MKLPFSFILCIFIISPLCATTQPEYNLEYAQSLITNVDQDITDLTAQYTDIIDSLSKIDPMFVIFLEQTSWSEIQKIGVIRSYLADKTFNHYKNKFLSDMKQRSQETGRKINTFTQPNRSGGEYTSYQLDGGHLDEPECHLNNNVHDSQTCDYPDGYEDFYIVIETYGPSQPDTPDMSPSALSEMRDILGTRTTLETIQNQIYSAHGGNKTKATRIVMYRDFPTQNRTLHTTLRISYTSNNQTTADNTTYNQFIENDINFQIIASIGKYDEEHANRNAWAQLARTGQLDDPNIDPSILPTIPASYIYTHTVMSRNSNELNRTNLQ